MRLVDLRYRAQTWDRERRVVAKIEWHDGELFPRVGFIVTNSKLPAGKVVKVCNGRGDVENRIKEGKNTLRWDKTSCRRFAANGARLLMGVLAYNLLHMLRQFYLMGEEVKRSMEWLIKRLIKMGARVAYHGRRWQVHVASAFPLARVLPSCVRVTTRVEKKLTECRRVEHAQNKDTRDLFINVTMVFACVGSHGTLHGDLVGSPAVSPRPSWVSKR